MSLAPRRGWSDTSDVKVYRVSGVMLLSHDSAPEWRKFVKYVRAVSEKEALEKVYSLLGSNHKVKRYHIRIHEVKEVGLEEVEDPYIVSLSEVTRLK